MMGSGRAGTNAGLGVAVGFKADDEPPDEPAGAVLVGAGATVLAGEFDAVWIGRFVGVGVSCESGVAVGNGA